MNKYMVRSDNGRHFGPFLTPNAAAKWANKHIAALFFNKNWTLVRLFKP
jgi:hypothetical protein